MVVLWTPVYFTDDYKSRLERETLKSVASIR